MKLKGGKAIDSNCFDVDKHIKIYPLVFQIRTQTQKLSVLASTKSDVQQRKYHSFKVGMSGSTTRLSMI